MTVEDIKASEEMSPAFGVLSDDFTGGLLVASYFEERGLECPVYFDVDAARADRSRAPIVVIATRSRLMPVADAEATIRRTLHALDELGCAAVAYKACASFDSTEEGNIGIAADLLSDHYDQVPLLISAGFPEFNATVHQGHLFYRGRLVSDSVKRFDPVTPMSDPDLVRFLSHQTRSPVGLISHLDLVRGETVAREAVARAVAGGHRHVLLDASDDADIEMSARLAKGSRAIVASDPLVIAFGLAQAAGRKGTAPSPVRAGGPAAVLAGSVGPVIEEQLAIFGAQHPIHVIDLLKDASEDKLIAEALEWTAAHFGTRPFAITTAAGEEDVRRIQARFGRLGAARRAERILAGIGASLHSKGIRRLIVVGGETSGSVVGALGIGKVRALPRGPLGGGFCVSEEVRPTSLFLKSGKLGAPDVLLRALDAMEP